MITASHNPPDWNGFKIKENFGGSSRPEVTKAVESFLDRAKSSIPSGMGTVETFDPKPEYLKHIASFVDLERIKNAGINAVLDPMHGSGSGYLKELIGLKEINGNRDPLFGGVNPEPIPVNLEDLASYVKGLPGLAVGLAIDGDADRIGGVDPSGTFITSHYAFSLILKHLVENRKLDGKVVKTFNISRLVEKQAKKYGLPLDEVPIGFKYIADKMINEKVLIGGEESGGIGVLGNIPERDGSLCSLLLLELMAYEKKTLKQLLDGIMDELGYYYYDRIDLHLNREDFMPKIEKLGTIADFAGKPVVKIEKLDGVKLNFDDTSWILFRPSGTEPLLRIYAEAYSFDQVELLLEAGQKLIRS
ncbi:MAG TPA: phosphoglucomutase/phosphomannomutase family protein, partial [Candidatus Omnitrophota bacterium]|nr:phosphoglucomutase/phosphomannomutase family protein [Candidatus Omnitrophota bacterium]